MILRSCRSHGDFLRVHICSDLYFYGDVVAICNTQTISFVHVLCYVRIRVLTPKWDQIIKVEHQISSLNNVYDNEERGARVLIMFVSRMHYAIRRNLTSNFLSLNFQPTKRFDAADKGTDFDKAVGDIKKEKSD